jgi:hypothetical protein
MGIFKYRLKMSQFEEKLVQYCAVGSNWRSEREIGDLHTDIDPVQNVPVVVKKSFV